MQLYADPLSVANLQFVPQWQDWGLRFDTLPIAIILMVRNHDRGCASNVPRLSVMATTVNRICAWWQSSLRHCADANFRDERG